MDWVIYEDDPRYDTWFKIILAVPLLILILSAGLLIAQSEATAMLIIFGVVLLLALMFWLILPRKFIVMQDKLVIKLGGPFSIKIAYKDIKSAGKISWKSKNFAMNFTSSVQNTVNITASRGLSVNFSPSHREQFLENLNEAMDKWKKNNIPA
jgi:hypothetical protein